MMKISAIISIATLAVAAAPAAFAQTGGQAGVGGNTGYGISTAHQNRSGLREPLLHAKKLIGTQAKNFQGQAVGNIHDIVFTPNGAIFAAIDIGNGRFALVPWQALRINQDAHHGWFGGRTPQVTINTTRQALQNAPSIQGQEAEQINPNFLKRVYAFYNPGGNSGAVGAAGGHALGGANMGAGAGNGAGAGAGANVGGIGAGVGAGGHGGANNNQGQH